MTETCSDLVSFVDGELDAEHAEAFRAHLRTCDACQTGLVEAMCDRRSAAPHGADAMVGAPAAPVGRRDARTGGAGDVPADDTYRAARHRAARHLC
ncbi:MAG: hypothetical protein E6J91_17335 [Deltaproteobacteria bacterium]|nr:MAG: hypothetical protein E6J91_17335 [Deltaproteobacteria bacterium]